MKIVQIEEGLKERLSAAAETMPELTVATVGVLPCFDMRDYDNPNKYRWRSPLCLLSPHILVVGIFTRRA